jgi:hypothetical protein
MVDLNILKTAIYTFVQLGYIQADIKGEGGVYEWSGDKNNETIYGRDFQAPLIERTKQEYN